MAEIAAALGLDCAGMNVDAADAAIAEISRLFAAIGITPTLKDLGLAADRIEWTSEQALGIERLIKNNPRAIDLAAMRRLVQAAYDGDLAASAH
jgi:alcohol dehydrogenase